MLRTGSCQEARLDPRERPARPKTDTATYLGVRRAAVILVCAQVTWASAQEPGRVARLNEEFLKHLETLDDSQALAAAAIRRGWEATYRKQSPEGFVPDALAVLYPTYRDALQAFDAGGRQIGEVKLKRWCGK